MLRSKFFFIPLTAILSLAGCKAINKSLPSEPVVEKETSTTVSTTQVENNKVESKSSAPIKWLSIEEAAARQKAEPRKMVIDVYTDWCGWCKKMDKSTFTDKEVAAYINKNYYAVKLNAEGKEPITLYGRTFKYNPEYKAHELAIALLNGQMSFPTTVYLDEEMKMLSPVPGYLDAPAFAKILSYFGENHHKTMSWQEYEKQK